MNGIFGNIKYDFGEVCLLVDFFYCFNKMLYRNKEEKGFIWVYSIGCIVFYCWRYG